MLGDWGGGKRQTKGASYLTVHYRHEDAGPVKRIAIITKRGCKLRQAPDILIYFNILVLKETLYSKMSHSSQTFLDAKYHQIETQANIQLFFSVK